MWLFYVYLIECMLSQRINILHDVFQHICESLCNQQCIFLYQSIANRKTGGGPGENRGGTEWVIHTIWKYLKKPGENRGRTRDHLRETRATFTGTTFRQFWSNILVKILFLWVLLCTFFLKQSFWKAETFWKIFVDQMVSKLQKATLDDTMTMTRSCLSQRYDDEYFGKPTISQR